MQFMNTIISKEKLEELLKSKDLEIRKIAENIILENFDVNFYMYVYDNLNERQVEISLDDIYHPLYVPNGTILVKEFLKVIVLYPEYSKFCTDIVDAIFEYDDRIRNK